MLEKYFQLKENKTTVWREAIGGLTTFLTMSYIIFMQPVILKEAGMDFGAVVTTTCVASALSAFVMAFVANYPIALAPGVGMNVFFAFTVCKGLGYPWQTALGGIFIAGIIFIFLSLYGFREYVMNILPSSLKFGIAVGIGLMISLLGFEWAGIVVNHQVTFVSIGHLNKPWILISGLGLIVSMVLTCLQIRGAILLGILVSGAAALGSGLIQYKGIYSAPPSMSPTFLALDPWHALQPAFFPIIFVFLIMALFDTVGTLVGVGELGGFMKNGELPRAKQALLSDAIGTIIGAVCGTSTVTSYVESCAGISDGARTGLANIFTGMLFILALFFSPLVMMLGQGIQTDTGSLVYPVIAPSLIMVGFMMMRGVKMIPWDDPVEGLPAFLTILIIAFSFSITEGIAFGIISYTVLSLLTGRFNKLHPALIVLTILFLFRYFYMAI